MQLYNTFIFDSVYCEKDTGEIHLLYSLDEDVIFEEIITLPSTPKPLGEPSQEALLALHIAGGTSYYKTCLPKKIELRSGTLTKSQADFWNTVYEKGLGEFFYQNTIDFRGMVQFPSATKTEQPEHRSGKGVLVPIGGGKDSIVTIEKLRKAGKNITLFRMGAHPLIDALVEQIGLPCITVKRSLPAVLFRLNEEGALNGHVPISAYLSALCVVIAEMYGFTEIAMSNEKSSNYGNVEYLGTEINHQWSKSQEFEEMFQKYITENIDDNLKYYSALRELSELQIAEEFSSYPQYFELFSSCNRNWKIAGEKQKERWCGQCPKCAFSFCLFAACLPKSAVLHIFGKDLFQEPSLQPLYKELLGLEGVKPFECVGTPEEVREAFQKAHKRAEYDETPIMKMYLSSL